MNEGNIDEVKKKIFVKSFEDGKKTTTDLNEMVYLDVKSYFTYPIERNEFLIKDAQGFNVLEISSLDAFNAKQELGSRGSFKQVLEAAGIEYHPEKRVHSGDYVDGYIAVHTGQSGINVFKLKGEISLSDAGDVDRYSEILLKGEIAQIGDVNSSLDRYVRTFKEYEGSVGLSDTTASRIREGLKSGNFLIPVQKEGKEWFGSCIEVSCYGVPVFDKEGKLSSFNMMSVTKKEDGSLNNPVPLRHENGKIVQFSVDGYLKFEKEAARADDSMIRPYLQNRKVVNKTKSASMEL